MGGLHTGLAQHELSAQVRHRAHARGRETLGLCPQAGQQFSQSLRSAGRVRDQNRKGRTHHRGHRNEVGQGVLRVGVHDWHHEQTGCGRKEQRVTIWRRPRYRLMANDAGRTGSVLDHHILAQERAEVARQ